MGMSESGGKFGALKIILEVAFAGLGFVMGLLFAFQLNLGNVPGFFMGLLGAIFTFILAQGLGELLFRILKK